MFCKGDLHHTIVLKQEIIFLVFYRQCETLSLDKFLIDTEH